MRLASKFFLMALVIIFALTNCKKDPEPEVEPHPSPVKIDSLTYRLSDLALFYGTLSNLNPTDNVIPYDLNTPLYSDYASKKRFIYLTSGTEILYNEDGSFDFPNGAILLKSFYFDKDFRNPSLGNKILETRVLFKEDNVWTFASYQWNDEQTEAYLSETSKEVNISWKDINGISQTTNYYIPSTEECAQCHQNNEDILPLGIEARHLNRNYSYNGKSKNQLTYFKEKAFINTLPEISTISKAPVWNDPTTGTLEQRARAYLDINCGHCHNPNGQANYTIHLNWEAADEMLGKCKMPDYGSRGGGFTYDIVPGKADSSVMVYRMNSTLNMDKMPPVAKSFTHKEGVQLIKDWINSMSGGCPE